MRSLFLIFALVFAILTAELLQEEPRILSKEIVEIIKWNGFRTGIKLLSWMDQFRTLILPPEYLMWESSSAFIKSQALATAARLNIAESLLKSTGDNKWVATPKTLHEIAAERNIINLAFFERLVNFLEQISIIEKLTDETLQLTRIGELLWDKHPKSSRAMIITQNTDHFLSASQIYSSMISKDLKSPFELYYTDYEKVWQFYKDFPENSFWFNKYMTSVNTQVIEHLFYVYNNPELFSFKSIIDIGGGQGYLINQILKQYIHHIHLFSSDNLHRFSIFDLPEVVNQEYIKQYWKEELNEIKSYSSLDFTDHVQLIEGSFFEEIPSGYDLYTLKFILHDWTDEDCIAILSNIRKAMVSSDSNYNPRLLIIENAIYDPTAKDIVRLSQVTIDMIMLTMTEGRERTTEEYNNLLQKSGFQMTRVLPTRSIVSIIEATPI